jgi:hypothetical protein
MTIAHTFDAETGELVIAGIVYPYNPEDHTPWTPETVASRIAELQAIQDRADEVNAASEAARLVAEAAAKAAEPNYFSKGNFFSLFEFSSELVMFNIMRKKAGALADADYAAVQSGAGTPEQQGLVMFEAFLTLLDAMDQVNLKDPRIAPGLAICKALGIVTTDARIAQILAGTPPV